MQEFFDKAGIAPVNKVSKNRSKTNRKNLVKLYWFLLENGYNKAEML